MATKQSKTKFEEPKTVEPPIGKTKAGKPVKVKREKSTTTKGHYVTNAQLLEAIAADKANGYKLSPRLSKYLWMIAERYSFSPSFANYSFREDMVSLAVVNLCQNWYKFDPEKSDNPFAFYTTAAYRSFLQYLADEKKHREIRDTLLVEAGSSPSFAFQEKTRVGVTHDEAAFTSGNSGD
jgi:DNA-directed RNA polymerase specialized sigma24 family protein